MKAHMVEEKSKKKKPENKKFSKAKKTTNFKYNGSILNLVNAIIVTKLVTMRVCRILKAEGVKLSLIQYINSEWPRFLAP